MIKWCSLNLLESYCKEVLIDIDIIFIIIMNAIIFTYLEGGKEGDNTAMFVSPRVVFGKQFSKLSHVCLPLEK